MKRKVEIIDEKSETIQLTKLELIDKLQSDLVATLINYDLDDETILELIDFIPVDIFLKCYDPSESLVKKMLEIEYLSNDRLSDFSLTTISKFSSDFLESKLEFIDPDRLLLNYSTQDEEFFLKKNPKFFIENSNLQGPYFWRILSSNKLSKETILGNLDKLDWLLLTINNNFSDFTEEEFELVRPYLNILESNKNVIKIEESNKVLDQDIDELINKVLQKYN